MAWGAVIFVEGKTDKIFITQYLESLGYQCVQAPESEESIPKSKESIQESEEAIFVRDLGGIDEKKLISDKSTQTIIPDINQTETALFILDANNSFAKKRNLFDQWKNVRDKKPDTLELFLMPNNKGNGDLETLLQAISTKKEIYDCINAKAIRECLTKKGYNKIPDDKGLIHAYCEANGIDNYKIDYTDNRYWDLGVSEMQPLQKFLKTYL